MNILVLGANGLIGSTCYRILSESSDYSVHGTIMNESHKAIFPKNTVKNIITNVNVLKIPSTQQGGKNNIKNIKTKNNNRKKKEKHIKNNFI